MKRKFLSLTACLVMALVACFTGCSPTPLNSPTGLKATDDKLTWNYVDSALGYILSVNDTEYNTGENYYSFSNMEGLVDGQSYTAKVKSKGDGYLKLNSEYSQSITFTYMSGSAPINPSNPTNPEEPTDDNDQKVDITQTEKNQILSSNNVSSSYYGVGRTINVITDKYANFTAESVGSAKVFDNIKLAQLNWYKEFIGDMQSTSYKGTSMSEYYNELNVDFKNSLNTSVSFSIFSAQAESSFGFSASDSYKNTTNEIFYSSSQYFGANLVAIDEYYDVRQFRNVLSQKFLNDASAVQNGTMSVQELIALYGTHAIVAGYFGGKISYDYYLKSNSQKWDNSAALNYANKVGAAVSDIVSASGETSLSIAKKLSQTIEVSEERFTAKSIGGENFNASTIEEFKSNYNVWVNSMNNPSIEKNVIVALPQKSLIAIWDLLPAEYSEAKTKIQTYFNTLANDVSNEFLSKYQRHYEEPNAPTISTAIDYETLNCALDNKYDYTKPTTPDQSSSLHPFKLGYFEVVNANVNGDNLGLVNGYDSSISFKLSYNTKNLPIAGNCTSTYISDDSNSYLYYNLPYNIGNQKTGYGLIVATVTYKDGTPQHKVLITDAFKDKNIDDGILIIDGSRLKKDCTVDISIVYELHHWAPGFLGISDDFWSNWRINKTFEISYN